MTVAATPLPGPQIDVTKTPYDVRTLTATDIVEAGGATASLSANIGAVQLSDNLDDPFQPDLLYRGFEASPVMGTPQGLAVYQSGVRINEAFGDAVNWDLIPDDAVARIDVVGSNPVYGLNALGGAVVISMKTGFDSPGGEADLSGGSFGQRAANISYGAHDDRYAAFVSLRASNDDGWREFSADQVRQGYADFAARGGRLSLDLSLTGADNVLEGESATPVQELAVDRRLVFTSPQSTTNRLGFAVLTAAFQATPTLSLEADAFGRTFDQAVVNGNTTDYVACSVPALIGELCQSDAATPLATAYGLPIPDLSLGGSRPIGEIDRQAVKTGSYGASLQASSTARLFGMGNQLTIGGSAGGADIAF
ncbi:MAG TPA: Plug domain-containing protein, partial [Caulobacteraceae bacterium]|nr:Plug domain-containing protein [Caulobacteraceae bacterium]